MASVFHLCFLRLKEHPSRSGRGEGQAVPQRSTPFGGFHHLQQKFPSGIHRQVRVCGCSEESELETL